MTDFSDMTDVAATRDLGERISRHRLSRNLTQAQLAREAGISTRTLVRLEAGESTQLTNLIRVLRALGLLGNLEALVPPAPPSPMELLRHQGEQRRRASGRKDADSAPAASEEWTWGDDSASERGEESAP